MKAAYDPGRQIGWYRERNTRICELAWNGVSKYEISLMFGLTVETINRIVKAYKENDGR